MPNKDEWLPQITHVCLAFFILLVAESLGATLTIISSAFLGFVMGAIREITEDQALQSRGNLTDILGWTIGGLLAGIIFTPNGF